MLCLAVPQAATFPFGQSEPGAIRSSVSSAAWRFVPASPEVARVVDVRRECGCGQLLR